MFTKKTAIKNNSTKKKISSKNIKRPKTKFFKLNFHDKNNPSNFIEIDQNVVLT